MHGDFRHFGPLNHRIRYMEIFSCSKRLQTAAFSALTAWGAPETGLGGLGRSDSNQGMAGSKSAALPLGYAPKLADLPPDHNGAPCSDQRLPHRSIAIFRLSTPRRGPMIMSAAAARAAGCQLKTFGENVRSSDRNR